MKFAEMKNLDSLIKETESATSSTEDAPEIDYKTKDKGLGIIYDGYTTLPEIYQEVFLEPLKKLASTWDYKGILDVLDMPLDTGEPNGPWRDWLASINQRTTGYNREDTHAFEESIADLFDGYLSMEQRRNIKPPDYETVSPLVVWGRPNMGPYTLPADPDYPGPEFPGLKLGMRMAVVSLPPAYSKNVALWAAIGHETGGHDILHADKGLLEEISNVVGAEIMKHKDNPAIKNEQVIRNNRPVSLARYAVNYWKNRMDETASDVLGILNLGPAAGISLAVLLTSYGEGVLYNIGLKTDEHPIDALRVYLAAEVIRGIEDLDANIANTWADALEQIVETYSRDKSNFRLFTPISPDDFRIDVVIPYDGMREIVKIVARAIAFTPLNSLESHSLSEINTWATSDEELTWRIIDDFLDQREPSLEPGPAGDKVYAAHIISGAVIALANSTTSSTDIQTTTELAIKALNQLYIDNPVWRGYPVHFRSNTHVRNILPYKKSPILLEKRGVDS